MYDTSGIGVFLGLDVGKGEHHGHGLTPAGKKVFDKQLPNSEPRLRQVFDKLKAKFGTVLVIVDQPANIGALPLTVARDCGCEVAYLPGLAMRRLADTYEGEAKTDARDAFVIADVARTNPRTLRQITVTDQTEAELAMLVGFDDDLAGESTRTSNRLRGLLAQIHPSLERVLGKRIRHPAVLELLSRYGSPQQLHQAGGDQIAAVLKPKAPRMAARLAAEITTALAEQTVVVPGTTAAEVIVPSLARQLAEILTQRDALEGRLAALLEAHPLHRLLTSMPGVGVRIAATVLITIGDGRTFPDADHLASYAGLSPATKSSGSSIKGEHAPKRGNRQLKRAMFLSAFAALHDPASRDYYDRHRNSGKTHTQALLRLARRRITVLFAMLRDGCLYESRPASA
ncbi:transposase IS116/IS110/IS902 family protein [Catenulispora acidiphila DSM 44928]|uniref:Transposase IS116/IS110/IS902 family protein n=1 Tax=Catenulispora acidiphila (strain DSM 44928 / JCM 14897 / NBRC 102108 / NRRL B-24433 / ID139908) TaxID=479433 RepID=C7Q663_CATAD|nr:IS110 family transposase [Catenulispora acidiphila]ACU72069.1 transposase IS116/IS110/IS902 family protein [Catenulispora acidiphila DSM 44928]